MADSRMDSLCALASPRQVRLSGLTVQVVNVRVEHVAAQKAH